MNFDELVNWLFERATLHPQLGFAGKDKRAWCWIPGTKPMNHETVTRAIKSAPLRGCTQLAYGEVYKPMATQQCEICWVGLDIDAEDNPGLPLAELSHGWFASMVRTSCSGKGLHVIYRLDNPVPCTSETAGRLVKAIAAPFKAEIEATGIHVCKADKRMFWLHGGENEIISRDDDLVFLPSFAFSPSQFPMPRILSQDVPLSPTIRGWCEKLGLATNKKHSPVYVGDVVESLRSLGERVDTKSQCRGNGHVNGYIDLDQFSISLWSYADGHTIWAFEDVEGLINGN